MTEINKIKINEQSFESKKLSIGADNENLFQSLNISLTKLDKKLIQLNNIILKHNYGNRHNQQQAQDFNQELYNHLHCDYNNATENKYFNETTEEEIEQQKEDLKKLKELYEKEDSVIEYRNKLNEYLEKYVYSKRKWEDFRESEVKHDIGHNLRLEYLVENILNEVEKTIDKNNKEELQKFEQFKKDAITFAVMHDITHRGSPDFTDHESSIQFIEFIKFIKENEQDVEYLQDILADKDKENIQIEKDRIENEEKEINETNKLYSNLISALVSLGDCVEYRRYGEVDQDILQTRKGRIKKCFNEIKQEFGITIEEKELEEKLETDIDKVIKDTTEISEKMELQFYMGGYIYNNLILESEQIDQMQILKNFDLLTDKIPNSKTPKEFLQNYLHFAFSNKPKTNRQTKESFEAMRELREENIYFLLRGCGFVIEDDKYKINSDSKPGTIEYANAKKESDDKKIEDGIEDEVMDKGINQTYKVYHIPHEINIDGKKYIVIETIYKDKFVDVTQKEAKRVDLINKKSGLQIEDFNEEHKIRHREFKIYKNETGIDIKDLKKSNNLEEDKNRLQTIKSLKKVDEQDIKHIFDPISEKLIEKEREFQLKRLKRLDPFIDKLFEGNNDLIEKTKKELENCITIIFNNGGSLEEKFKATQKLASLLKVIKTSYKQDKKLTNHFLMLSNICRIASTKTFEEGKEEFQAELNYLYEVGTARTYNKERNKENPFKNKQFKDKNIFRFVNSNSFNFKQTDHFNNTLLSDYFYTPDKAHSNEKKYRNLVIGFAESRANTTSFADFNRANEQYLEKYMRTGFMFVARPSQENIGGLIAKSAIIDKGTKGEYNTYKMETQNVAFVLKIEEGNFTDVIFNEDYNGEFYIKDENGNKTKITQDELTQKILELGKDEYKLQNFLENQLVMEKLIEKSKEEITNEAKTRDLKVPEQFQEVMGKLMQEKDYSEKMDRLNNLMELYYNIEENKKKELLKENIEELLENENKYKNYIYNGYIKPINIDKLIKYYKEFNEEQKNNIIAQLENHINDLIKENKEESNNKINLYLKKLIKIKLKSEKFNIVFNNNYSNILRVLYSYKNLDDFLSVFIRLDNCEEIFVNNIRDILDNYNYDYCYFYKNINKNYPNFVDNLFNGDIKIEKYENYNLLLGILETYLYEKKLAQKEIVLLRFIKNYNNKQLYIDDIIKLLSICNNFGINKNDIFTSAIIKQLFSKLSYNKNQSKEIHGILNEEIFRTYLFEENNIYDIIKVIDLKQLEYLLNNDNFQNWVKKQNLNVFDIILNTKKDKDIKNLLYFINNIDKYKLDKQLFLEKSTTGKEQNIDILLKMYSLKELKAEQIPEFINSITYISNSEEWLNKNICILLNNNIIEDEYYANINKKYIENLIYNILLNENDLSEKNIKNIKKLLNLRYDGEFSNVQNLKEKIRNCNNKKLKTDLIIFYITHNNYRKTEEKFWFGSTITYYKEFLYDKMYEDVKYLCFGMKKKQITEIIDNIYKVCKKEKEYFDLSDFIDNFKDISNYNILEWIITSILENNDKSKEIIDKLSIWDIKNYLNMYAQNNANKLEKEQITETINSIYKVLKDKERENFDLDSFIFNFKYISGYDISEWVATSIFENNDKSKEIIDKLSIWDIKNYLNMYAQNNANKLEKEQITETINSIYKVLKDKERENFDLDSFVNDLIYKPYQSVQPQQEKNTKIEEAMKGFLTKEIILENIKKIVENEYKNSGNYNGFFGGYNGFVNFNNYNKIIKNICFKLKSLIELGGITNHEEITEIINTTYKAIKDKERENFDLNSFVNDLIYKPYQPGQPQQEKNTKIEEAMKGFLTKEIILENIKKIVENEYNNLFSPDGFVSFNNYNTITKNICTNIKNLIELGNITGAKEITEIINTTYEAIKDKERENFDLNSFVNDLIYKPYQSVQPQQEKNTEIEEAMKGFLKKEIILENIKKIVENEYNNLFSSDGFVSFNNYNTITKNICTNIKNLIGLGNIAGAKEITEIINTTYEAIKDKDDFNIREFYNSLCDNIYGKIINDWMYDKIIENSKKPQPDKRDKNIENLPIGFINNVSNWYIELNGIANTNEIIGIINTTYDILKDKEDFDFINFYNNGYGKIINDWTYNKIIENSESPLKGKDKNIENLPIGFINHVVYFYITQNNITVPEEITKTINKAYNISKGKEDFNLNNFIDNLIYKPCQPGEQPEKNTEIKEAMKDFLTEKIILENIGKIVENEYNNSENYNGFSGDYNGFENYNTIGNICTSIKNLIELGNIKGTKEKQQIIQKTYKICKNQEDFNKDDFINQFKEVQIGNFELNEEVLKQWDEEIEKNKPIYKFINNEEYSKNIEGFINDCRKELKNIKIDKKYIEIVVNHIEKLKEKKQEFDKSEQIENIWSEINKELENKIDTKEIDNCLGFGSK